MAVYVLLSFQDTTGGPREEKNLIILTLCVTLYYVVLFILRICRLAKTRLCNDRLVKNWVTVLNKVEYRPDRPTYLKWDRVALVWGKHKVFHNFGALKSVACGSWTTYLNFADLLTLRHSSCEKADGAIWIEEAILSVHFAVATGLYD